MLRCLRPGNIVEEERGWQPEDQGLGCDVTSPSEVRGYTHISTDKKPTWGCHSKHTKLERGFSPVQRSRGNRAKQGAGEVVLSREEHTSWLSQAKWSLLKTRHHMDATVILGNTCVYTHTYRHAVTISEREPWIWSGVERDMGGFGWRKGMETCS